MTRQGLLGLFIVGIVWFGVGGCTSDALTTDELGRVRVNNLTFREKPGGARILEGELENLSDQPIRVAQIDVSLFDSDNRRVESMMILVRDIAPGESVTFREAVRSENDIRGAKPRAVFVP